MKVNEIKRLAEAHTEAELAAAAAALENGEPLPFAVEGDDEGECLTHLLGALDVHRSVREENLTLKDALRAFAKRVRDSIG
jgi:hypothetical protein